MTVAAHSRHIRAASIKVSGRKRRNPAAVACLMSSRPGRLNESPSEKEGKFVDEFAALGATGLIDAVERSRSHGGAVMLSAQSLTGLNVVGDGFLDRVSASTSVKLMHRAEAEAEALAQLLGTRKGFAETTQTFEDADGLGSQIRASGQGSLREVDKFRVHPNTFRTLAPGEVVAMWSVPQLTAEVVSVRKTGLPAVDDEPAGEPEHQQRQEPEAESQGSAGGKEDDEMWGWS